MKMKTGNEIEEKQHCFLQDESLGLPAMDARDAKSLYGFKKRLLNCRSSEVLDC